MKRFRLTVAFASAVFIAAYHSDVVHAPRTELARVAGEETRPCVEPAPPVIPLAPEPRAVVPLAPVAPPPRAVSPDPRSLIVPPDVIASAREWVGQLGSDDFGERESAAANLVRMGRLARPALLEAVGNHPDPEVRQRCARLLPKATEAEMNARLSVYLADTEERFDDDVPGVKTFRKHFGGRENVRALAAAVLRYPDNRNLFAAIESGSAAGTQSLMARRDDLYRALLPTRITVGKRDVGRQPVLEETVGVFVAEIDLAAVDTVRVGPSGWVDGSEFLWTDPCRHALAGFGPHADAHQEVVAKWIATRTAPAALHGLTVHLSYAGLQKFKEAFPALCRVVSTPGVDASEKTQALGAVAGYPLEQALPVLLATLGDETLVQTVRFPRPDGTVESHPCRLGDVARILIIHLTEQSVESYGYEYPEIYGPGRFADTAFIFKGGCVIRTEQKRAAAMMRFGWWQLKRNLQ